MKKIITYRLSTSVLAVLMSEATDNRLATTCFRTGPAREAGNFFAWQGIEGLLNEDAVCKAICEVAENVASGVADPGTKRITAQLPKVVGWASTVPTLVARSWHLEGRSLNRNGHALFVVDVNKSAPQTRLATVIFGVRHCKGEWVVEIYNAYPGKDHGRSDGNVSAQKGRVFFDSHNPGSSTWVCDE